MLRSITLAAAAIAAAATTAHAAPTTIEFSGSGDTATGQEEIEIDGLPDALTTYTFTATVDYGIAGSFVPLAGPVELPIRMFIVIGGIFEQDTTYLLTGRTLGVGEEAQFSGSFDFAGTSLSVQAYANLLAPADTVDADTEDNMASFDGFLTFDPPGDPPSVPEPPIGLALLGLSAAGLMRLRACSNR